MLFTTLISEELNRARMDYATANERATQAMSIETYPFENYEQEKSNYIHANLLYLPYDIVRGVGRRIGTIFDKAIKERELGASDDALVQTLEHFGSPLLLGATKDTVLSLLRK